MNSAGMEARSVTLGSPEIGPCYLRIDPDFKRKAAHGMLQEIELAEFSQ